MPLFEKARIEVHLPDLPARAYRELLDALNREFTYAFGGCSILHGLAGAEGEWVECLVDRAAIITS